MGVVMVPFLLWGVIVAGTRSQQYRRLTALILSGALLYTSLSRASMLAGGVAVIATCVALHRQRLLVQGAFVAVLFLASAAVLNPTHFETFVRAITSEVLYKGKQETAFSDRGYSVARNGCRNQRAALVRYRVRYQLLGGVCRAGLS